ncbi:M43 family zinc metalloprotease [Emticicia sp. SJ17W-69]|uniref:M43 family zinc metalloprotease n=1 Tax=Emticicia sp. SJ17W-69 TaxID=3421657 RepID=UPI003EBED66E
MKNNDDNYFNNEQINMPILKIKADYFENKASGSARITITESTVYIPVVVHVVESGQPNEIFPTEADIIAKIAGLNSIFNGTSSGNHLNIGIQFRMAKHSPNCLTTNGINKVVDFSNNIRYKNGGIQFETSNGISEVSLKKNTQWDGGEYLNIWVVNEIDGINSGAFTNFSDKATALNGIVITANDFINDPTVLVHEFGHFFNLLDLFKNIIEPSYRNCGDDEVSDTDLVSIYSGPPRIGNNSCVNRPYTNLTENNFMSLNNTRTLFTQGQKERMVKSLEHPNRKSLINSLTDEIATCIFNSTNTPIFTTNTFKTVGIGKGGYIYAGTANNGLYKFNGHDWEKLAILTNNNINDIKADKNDGIWIAQYGNTSATQAINGGVNYLPDATETGHIYFSPSTSGLPNRNCRALFIDIAATQLNPRIWTANMSQVFSGEITSGAIGLGVFDSSPTFEKITGGIDLAAQTVSVQTIGGNANEIWAFVSGNYGKNQILVYDSQTAAYKKAYDNTSIGFSFPSNFLAKSIYFDKFKYFDEIEQKEKILDRRWVGVSNSGVLVHQKPYDQISDGLWYYLNTTTHPYIFPTGSVVNNNSITSDENGYIYIGTNKGLVVFNGLDLADINNFKLFTTADGLPSNNILDIVENKPFGKLVIATDQGIVLWSKSKVKNNSKKIELLNISENFNQNHYTVPRESTVHHYFIAKNNSTNKAQEGVYIIYKISNNPDAFLISQPSDEKGLIDLNFSVGGGDVTISSDDYIPAGSNEVTVSFVEAYDENLELIDIGNNNFKNNPFKVSVIDKAEPVQKEMGAGISLEAGVEYGSAEIKFLGLKFGAKSASLNAAYIFKPTVSVVIDKNNPNLWLSSFTFPQGIKLEGNAGPKSQMKDPVINITNGGDASIELALSGSSIEEYSYLLDLQKSQDRFFFGSQLMNMALTPGTLMAGVFLRRLSTFSETFESEKLGFNFNIECNAEIGLNYSQEFQNENIKNLIGFEYGASLFSTDYSLSLEKTKSNEINEEINISADIATNLGVLVGILPNEIGEPDILPFILNTNPKAFSASVTRHLDSYGGNLLDATASFSNSKDIKIGSDGYNLKYNNSINYSKDAIQKISTIPLNFVSKYFKDGNFISSPISLAANYLAGSGNPVAQIKAYQKKVFDKPSGTFNSKEIIIKNDREILNKIDHQAINFAIKAVVGVDFELGYSEWNKYTHNFKDYVYSREFNKMLQTTDYAKIEENLELPKQTPIKTFLNNLKTEVDNAPIALLNAAISFLSQTSIFLGGQGIYLSNNNNGATLRLGLDAKPYLGGTKNTTTNQSATPSIFTFNIPGGNAAFNTNNEVLFKYYYPENQLDAVTLKDTFKIVTDVFFLNVRNNNSNLTSAPNGFFTLNTQFNTSELELAGLSTSLIPKVLFLPINSKKWEVIGDINQTINFNRLGIFAIGVGLEKDFIAPMINVVPPLSFVDGQNFQFSLTDNLSGIDWSKTYFICNNTNIPFQRVGSNNKVTIPISALHTIGTVVPETFAIQILTVDLQGNKKNYSNTFPCSKSLKFLSVVGYPSGLSNKQQASQTIEIKGSAATRPPLEIKAGKNIILNPGFEVRPISGEYFKANIGGCN